MGTGGRGKFWNMTCNWRSNPCRKYSDRSNTRSYVSPVAPLNFLCSNSPLHFGLGLAWTILGQSVRTSNFTIDKITSDVMGYPAHFSFFSACHPIASPFLIAHTWCSSKHIRGRFKGTFPWLGDKNFCKSFLAFRHCRDCRARRSRWLVMLNTQINTYIAK